MRLLVFNCHEAWVYQLGILGYGLDIIVGLEGRYTDGWDERMRPLPRNARLIGLREALESGHSYHCVICHNISDLLDVKTLLAPRIMVLHTTLDGRLHEEGSRIGREKMRGLLSRYLTLVAAHAVAVSPLKAASWGIKEDIVPFGADPEDYMPYCGKEPLGIRISNEISKRKGVLMWNFHEEAFRDIPVRLVGHNHDMDGIEPARSWAHLKQMLSSHRFYVHTADPRYEDGYNMATLEAMAAGMPVLGNRHPTSPVEHGVSGFLSDDPDKLRTYAMKLLEDRDLAARMGEEARTRVARRFSPAVFKQRFTHSIQLARAKWEMRAGDANLT
jgi:hypothetical protein